MDDRDSERFRARLRRIGSPARDADREKLRRWMESMAEVVAMDFQVAIDAEVEPKRVRCEMGLALIPIALQQVYELCPPQAAIVKAGLFLDEDGMVTLPGGNRLPIGIHHMLYEGAGPAVALLRSMGSPDPRLTTFVSSLVSFMLHRRWMDALVESTAEAVFGISDDAAAFLEIGVEMAMEDFDVSRMALALAMGGLETYPGAVPPEG